MSSPQEHRIEPASSEGPARLLDGVLIVGVFLMLALLLGQDRFYKVDGHGIVRTLALGEGTHPRHPLAVPIIRVLALLLEPLGVEAFRIATIASAGFTAAGIFLGHVAMSVLGMERRRAAVVTLLVATCPAVLFYATVVEFHGVFMAFVGLSLAGAAYVAKHASNAIAASLGLSIGVAAAVHGTGHLLSPILIVFVWFSKRRNGESLVATSLAIALIVVAHLGVVLATRSFFGGGLTEQQASFWTESFENLSPVVRLPFVVWIEWIRPFAVVSLLCFLGLRRVANRPVSFAFSLGLVLYLATSFVLIPRGDERGAYQLPLVFFAAMLAQSALTIRLAVVAAIVSLVIGVVEVRIHDVPDRSGVWMEAFEQVDRIHDGLVFPLVGDIDEVDALVRFAPARKFLVAVDLVQGLGRVAADQRPALRAGAISFLEAVEAQGKVLVVTAGWRRQVDGIDFGRELSRDIESRWALELAPSVRPRFWILRRR